MPKKIPSYVRMLIEGKPEDLDAATDLLFEAGCTGTEETQKTRFEAYFPTHVDIEHLSVELARNFPRLRCGSIEHVEDEDWSVAWKKDFHGFSLGEGFFVSPSWESPPRTDRIVLRIDPERGFGTGTHDTTRLSLELIEDHARAGISVIDAGTGTGILAMAAAALGCRPVIAIEADLEAASCARANIRRNHFGRVVQIHQGTLSEVTPPPAELVVANLNENVIKKNLVRLESWVQPRGTLILSGLLVEQVGGIVTGPSSDFRISQHRTAGEWAALVIKRASHA
jgi:ribosomal protein L11 methyltransferase